VTILPVTSGVFRCMAAMVLVSGLFQFGCSNAGRQASARLRTQVHQLEQHLEASKLHVAELESQLVTTGSAQPSVNVELEANTPQVAAIGLSPFSGMRRSEADRSEVELYVSSVDGRGRSLQMVGTLEAVIMHLPVNNEPRVLGRTSLGLSEVRDAWRSGLGGVSYLITVPLQGSVPASSLHARVVYKDGRTGVEHEASADLRSAVTSEE
jgi:hypothetical protein